MSNRVPFLAVHNLPLPRTTIQLGAGAKTRNSAHAQREQLIRRSVSDTPRTLEAVLVYETLRLDLRAQVENWSIDSDEIIFQDSQIQQDSKAMKKDTLQRATYRWADVAVAVHGNLYDESRSAKLLRNEIRVLAQLRHPHITSFLGASIRANECLVVTEYLSGGTLAEHYASRRAIQSARRRPWRAGRGQTLEWALALARAINYMHLSEPRVVHGGLRPDRLLLTAWGALKVSGFNGCTIGASASDCCSGPRTASAKACGDGYLAPELLVACDCGRAAPSADIYAAASCIWFMRTGHHPDAAVDACEAGSLGWAGLAWVIAAGRAADSAGRLSADGLVRRLEALQSGGFCAIG
jgi:serine/threonine protein kinase